MEDTFDVIVIGGGHAACEAAAAAARLGASTLMLTMNLDHIAQMSCNPCIGGIAKGHLVREIDALGGVMGRVADAASIQFRMLNRTKGPAVWSPRAQCDKTCYQRAMKHVLEQTPNLTIRQEEAVDFTVDRGAVTGVVTRLGNTYRCKAVVTATGTFLHGLLHYGLTHFSGGRNGDPASDLLPEAIRERLGLKIGRLKTGTPPRVLGSSVDFSRMDVQESERDLDEHFSHFGIEDVTPQVSEHHLNCRMTWTTQATAELVRANLDKAPMYNGLIEGIGTRYCPSFEDKVVRFPDHERHLIYLEPEGEATDEYYVNGISTSLPPEVQEGMLRSIPGLEHVRILRFAYAIEYDFVEPSQLERTFAVRAWKGLYHAGQINGTSGYEEAAAQGLAAGLNAARFAAGLDGVAFGRDEAYLGVMADDLVTKEIKEPYRMFTSRAEYRLRLRQDNADLRLCRKAHELGLLSEKDFARFTKYEAKLNELEAAARGTMLPGGGTVWERLRVTQGDPDLNNLPFDPGLIGLDLNDRTDRRAVRELAVQSHYEGYLRQEEDSIRHLHGLEEWRIPDELDYAQLPGLKNETRLKLARIRPATLAQASRIDGMTPAEIGLLQVLLARRKREQEAATAVSSNKQKGTES